VRDFLTLADILTIHADQIEAYGGTHGVRDPGLLEAALYRAQTGYYSDLVEEAVALWESLSQNHPFPDENKRTAFAAMHTFLQINGGERAADADDAFEFVSGLYETGTFRFENLEAWLRSRVRTRTA